MNARHLLPGKRGSISIHMARGQQRAVVLNPECAMNAEELGEMQSRIRRYEDAKGAMFRYEKIQRTLDAIPEDEHNVGSIIIDVKRAEFRYLADDDKRTGLGICSMTRGDHDEFFGEFLEWAKDSIRARIDRCQKIMDES